MIRVVSKTTAMIIVVLVILVMTIKITNFIAMITIKWQ